MGQWNDENQMMNLPLNVFQDIAFLCIEQMWNSFVIVQCTLHVSLYILFNFYTIDRFFKLTSAGTEWVWVGFNT